MLASPNRRTGNMRLMAMAYMVYGSVDYDFHYL